MGEKTRRVQFGRDGEGSGLRDAPSGAAAPTHRIGGLVAMPRVLAAFKVEPAALLVRAGLVPDALSSPEQRAPFSSLVHLLALAVRATRCPHLGLLIGEHWSLADTGVAGELARFSATVGEALETLTVHQRLNSQGAAAYLVRYAATAELGFAVFQQQAEQLVTVYDIAIAAQVSAMRELCGPAWNPDEVLLPRASPADERPYRAWFRCPVVFNSERAALRFPLQLLERPVATADPARRRALESDASRHPDDDLALRLHRSLRVLLVDGAVRESSIAEQFAMHRRTLERHLKARGITFQSVLDGVRFEVACQLLRDTELSMARIGAAVGFLESSSFSRAFARWSGVSPVQWRRTRARSS